MKKINIKIVTSLFILSLFNISCDKDIIDGFKYEVEQKADLKNLLIVPHADHIFGIDTVDFTIKAQITIKDMVFGGVAKLPDGGIVFTHHRRASNNAWGNQMYIVNRNCELIEKIDICDSPIAPKVIENRIYVGSSAIEEGVKYKFQVYDATTYSLVKKFQFRYMLDAWRYSKFDNEVYLPISPEELYNKPREYSYIIKFDTETSDTTSIRFSESFALSPGLNVSKQDNILYIFGLIEKMVIKYDIEQHRVIAQRDLNEYPIVSELNAWHIAFPKVKGDFLYGFLGGGSSNGKTMLSWVKISLNDLSLVEYKLVDVYPGGFAGNEKSYEGNYFVVRSIDNVNNTSHLMFIDYTTGEIVEYVKIEASYFNN
jgi:hypothetical protein